MPRQATTISQKALPVPTNGAELETLQRTRGELSDQLRELSATRERLVGERYNASVNQNPAMVGELDARIKDLGTRINRIEQQKLATDDAIAAGIAKGIGSNNFVIAPEIPPVPGIPGTFTGGFPFDRGEMRQDFREMMMAEAVGFVFFGFIAWQFAKRRWMRNVRAQQGISGETPANKELKDAVFAMAVEIERISENQRFVTKLLSERAGEHALIERGERK